MSRKKTDLHLLPSNATADERALSLAVQFGDDVLPEDIKLLLDPYKVPARFLPFMGWGRHVDYWDDALPEAAKRALVAGSWEWHRKKGTPFAIRRSLEAIGFDWVRISEWYKLHTAAHTFSVAVFPFAESLMRMAERCIHEYKPTRSWLLELIGIILTQETENEDENFFTYNSAMLGEYYPWAGARYDGTHRYASPHDAGALLYSDPSECETLVNNIHHSFIEHFWASYRYDGTFKYDGGIKYGSGEVEHEYLNLHHTQDLFGSHEIADTVLATEGYANTIIIYI